MPRLPRLGQFRERAGWTHKELAKRAKVPQRVVERTENGGEVFADTIRKLAEALGVTPEELAERDEDGAAQRPEVGQRPPEL